MFIYAAFTGYCLNSITKVKYDIWLMLSRAHFKDQESKLNFVTVTHTWWIGSVLHGLYCDFICISDRWVHVLQMAAQAELPSSEKTEEVKSEKEVCT
jgi:hypothetical protein